MSAILVIREATQADVTAILPRLRKADRLELELSSGTDVEATLHRAIETPGENLAGGLDGEVVVLGGCASDSVGVGVPWMVGTDKLTANLRTFIQLGGVMRARYEKQYALLTNFVHAENAIHIRWLRHIGFSFGETIPDFGVGKAPFIQFYRYSPCAIQP